VESFTSGDLSDVGERHTMKVTIVQYENMEDAAWDGEALYASWDKDTGEFVIRGDMTSQACTAVANSLAEKRKLLVEIEDTGPGQLIWRGYVGSAEFLSFDASDVECCLVMLLDDWFGIVPQFSTS
jgi:hypothetical protein